MDVLKLLHIVSVALVLELQSSSQHKKSYCTFCYQTDIVIVLDGTQSSFFLSLSLSDGLALMRPRLVLSLLKVPVSELTNAVVSQLRLLKLLRWKVLVFPGAASGQVNRRPQVGRRRFDGER